MLHNDRLTLALLLCRIHLKGVASELNLDQEFNFFLRGREGVFSNPGAPTVDGLNGEQQEAITRLASKLAAFKKLPEKIKEMPEFGAWLQQSTPEQAVPQLWIEEKQLSPIGRCFFVLFLWFWRCGFYRGYWV